MVPDEGLLNALTDLLVGGSKIKLVKSLPGVADKDMTYALLHGSGIEADYPSYAEQPVTWGSGAIVSPDDGKRSSGTHTFQPSGMSTPQTIYGYWVEMISPAGGGFKLLLFRRFTTPLVLASDASQIQIVIDLYDKDFSPP